MKLPPIATAQQTSCVLVFMLCGPSGAVTFATASGRSWRTHCEVMLATRSTKPSLTCRCHNSCIVYASSFSISRKLLGIRICHQNVALAAGRNIHRYAAAQADTMMAHHGGCHLRNRYCGLLRVVRRGNDLRGAGWDNAAEHVRRRSPGHVRLGHRPHLH